MHDKVCYIFGAGEFYYPVIKFAENRFIIAADGGFKYLHTKPDLIIGDFDSLPNVPDHGNIIRLNKEKDETDMFAAIKEGIANDCETFHIYGGTGGRIDHTLANIQSIAYLAEIGFQGYLHDKDYIITAIKNQSISFGSKHSGYLSIFAHDKMNRGVTLTGLKYSLENADISNTFPIGISNEFIGVESTVSVKDGTLIVIYSN
ncbi:MAG: thiamine diphosphokinase [Oscillospiraceae bacterium]|nr:thiamine diphosphokinase [Oscillospiraceae bacterium]